MHTKGTKFYMFNKHYYWAMVEVLREFYPEHSLDGYHDAKSVYNAGDEL